MGKYIVLVIILAIIAIITLIYFIVVTRLKEYKERMDKAESLIDTNLSKKYEVIINLNNSIKKVTGKKDYLKDYINTKDLIITNMEKDIKLDEAVKLVNELTTDFSKLNGDSDFNKQLKSLREIDEVLVSAKNVFNTNALASNKLIKNFPYNIIAKIAKFKIRGFYNNNKTDDGDNF